MWPVLGLAVVFFPVGAGGLSLVVEACCPAVAIALPFRQVRMMDLILPLLPLLASLVLPLAHELGGRLLGFGIADASELLDVVRHLVLIDLGHGPSSQNPTTTGIAC